MTNVTVICAGKLKETYLRDACAEYAKRLTAFCRLTVTELQPAFLPDSPSPAQIADALEDEGRRMLAKIPKGAYVVTLCVEGRQYSSEEFAKLIADGGAAGGSHIAFVIGSSFGLSDTVKARSNVRLSMSKMTFPHQLARVMLLEQIYRGFQIGANGKYHK